MGRDVRSDKTNSTNLRARPLIMKNCPINEALRERVGLEKLYPYTIEENLGASDGYPCSGLLDRKTGEIFINASLAQHKHKLIAVYLHEVGHLIAGKAGLDSTPGASSHNPYFAVLVAVMYRRQNSLEALSVYDFCDTAAGQRFYDRDSPILADGKLIERFEYIMRRSSQFAETSITIEQIADFLYKNEAIEHWTTGKLASIPKKMPWLDVMLGALVGISGTAATGALAALMLMK